MLNTIKWSEVLSEMKKLNTDNLPVAFSISVRTFNTQLKMGGKLLHFENATLLQPPKNKGLIRLADSTEFKNPNHFKNRTRNIKTNEGVFKINILFITKFNNQIVIF